MLLLKFTLAAKLKVWGPWWSPTIATWYLFYYWESLFVFCPWCCCFSFSNLFDFFAYLQTQYMTFVVKSKWVSADKFCSESFSNLDTFPVWIVTEKKRLEPKSERFLKWSLSYQYTPCSDVDDACNLPGLKEGKSFFEVSWSLSVLLVPYCDE